MPKRLGHADEKKDLANDNLIVDNTLIEVCDCIEYSPDDDNFAGALSVSAGHRRVRPNSAYYAKADCVHCAGSGVAGVEKQRTHLREAQAINNQRMGWDPQDSKTSIGLELIAAIDMLPESPLENNIYKPRGEKK